MLVRHRRPPVDNQHEPAPVQESAVQRSDNLQRSKLFMQQTQSANPSDYSWKSEGVPNINEILGKIDSGKENEKKMLTHPPVLNTNLPLFFIAH